jgi:CubicO group peptidase (beta-lactamase class C family)
MIGTAATAVVATWSSLQGTPSQASRGGDAPQPFARVRQLIREQMAATDTPSMAVAVTRGPDILWEEGFGYIDRIAGRLASADTAYYCASVTKAFTATALMILQERGALDLDRPANDYLGAVKISSSYWDAQQATVRRIAMQTSGLGTYDRNYVEGLAQERVSADEIIRRFGVILWRPGDHFDYSNLSYGIIGEVIAHASKETYATFLRREIFVPLGMTRTSLGLDGRVESAPRYNSASKSVSPASESSMPGASSVYSSAHDLALFGMFQLQDRPQNRQLLSSTAIDRLSDPTVDAGGGDRHSLAWWVRDDRNGYRTLLAQGGTSDAQAWLLLVPSERISIVILGNSGSTPASRVTDEILATLLPLYRETRDARATAMGPRPVSSPAASRVPPAESVGTWTGAIQTYRASTPLRITITGAGEVTASLGAGAATPLGAVRFRENQIAGALSADLAIRETDGVPYEMHLEVYRYGNRLVGGATSYPLAGRDGPRLSFFVDLTRQPN